MARMTPEQILELLETRKQRSGLSNSELQSMKDAKQAAWDNNPNSIAGVMRSRQNTLDAQDQAWRERNKASRAMLDANALQEQLGGGLIGQENLPRRSGRQQGIIGMDGPDKPEQYTYRDLKPGEKYDSDTDVMAQVDGGEQGIRRREVNPEYQKWVVAQAAKLKDGDSGSKSASPPPASVMSNYIDLLAKRRNPGDGDDIAAIDEQIALYQNQYPGLRNTGGGTGGAGGGRDVTTEQAAQTLTQAGIPSNVAPKLIGLESLQAPKEPINFSFSDAGRNQGN